jgi:hypothetical protein
VLRSFKFLDYLKHTEDGMEYVFRYQIVDDDFEEIDTVSSAQIEFEAVNAVVKTYSNRGLPIAPNIVRAVLQEQNPYWRTLEPKHVFAANARGNLRYAPFKDEVEKLLTIA